MQIERAKLDDLTAQVTLTIEPEDYQGRVESVLNNYRKQADMPGFRKGKVPMSLIRKQYAMPVLADEMNKIISEKLSEYINTEQLDVLGNPLPKTSTDSAGDWKNPTSFKFEYEIGLAPEISLDLPQKPAFTRHIIKVDKKAVDQAVEDHMRRHGSLSDVEQSEDHDLLIGDFQQLDAETGAPLEGGLSNETSISIEHLEDKKAKKILVGLAIGDQVTVDPHKVSRGHDDLAKMLNVSHEQVHNLQGDFQFTVREIKRLDKHENDQALWDKVLGKDVVNDEKAFREKVTEELTAGFDRDAEYLFRRRFVHDLMDRMNIPMPDEFLKRWILETNEKPITTEEVEADYPNYSTSMRWQLMQQAVMKATDMRVVTEELEQEAKQVLGAQYAQYGMPLDETMLTDFAKNTLADEEQRRRIADRIIERKVIDDLKTRVTIKEKKVSYEDFMKLVASVD
ncbi:MAG: trigger factor [Flavobacteriales bacterium]